MTTTTLLEPPAVIVVDTFVETVTVTEVERPVAPPAPMPIPVAPAADTAPTGWVRPWAGLVLVWLLVVATMIVLMSGTALTYGD